jgi:predicted nucleic acid-binding protein
LLSRFSEHFSTLFVVQPLHSAMMDLACELSARHPLRAYDAIQLAGCLAVWNSMGKMPPVFVCSDKALLAAAQAEGLPVLEPAAAADATGDQSL